MKLLTKSYNFRNVGYNLCYEAYNHIYKPCYNCHNFQSTPKYRSYVPRPLLWVGSSS